MLVAIAIPVFSAQLHRAQDATDLSNIRAYYAELQTKALVDGTSGMTDQTGLSSVTFQTGETVALKNLTYDVTVGDNSVKIDWECSSHKGGGESSGSFGGAASAS